MSSNGDSADGPSGYQPFTKAQHIQQLNDIDKSITQLLSSAGLALQALSATHATSDTPISERKDAFQEAAESYFTTLQKVDVILKRNIYSLEEAKIIPPQKKKTSELTNQKARVGLEDIGGDVASLGKLDIGWLNSRSGRVGRDMEAELWDKAKVFLEGLEADKSGEGKKDVDMSG